MVDQPAAEPDPITVNADPVTDQIGAGLRLTLVAAGSVAGALGYAGLAGKFSALVLVVGPVAAAIAYVWGIYKTGRLSAKAGALVDHIGDAAVAKFK